MTRQHEQARLLRRALAANGAFSLLCTAVMAMGARPLANAMGLGGPFALYAVAAGLLPFAGFVLWNARRSRVSARDALIVTFGDVAWVGGSVALVLGWPGLLTPTGAALVVGVAACVGLWAALQAFGLRRLARAQRLVSEAA